MTENALLVETSDHIATVSLNRPEKLNAMTLPMLNDLVRVFDALDRDNDVKAIILRSTSPDAFSAGADVNNIVDHREGEDYVYEPMKGQLRNTYEAIYECRKPTIAALQGWVVGGGMELAMACDMRIAGSSARFSMPEAKIGLGANFGSQMLPRLVARAHAYQILYSALEFDAEHALTIGFVSECINDSELQDRVIALAKIIATRAPLTLRRYKAMVNIASTLPVATALRLDPGSSPYLSDDRLEGAAAYRERRQPQWKGL